jgi:hypothetical protein
LTRLVAGRLTPPSTRAHRTHSRTAPACWMSAPSSRRSFTHARWPVPRRRAGGARRGREEVSSHVGASWRALRPGRTVACGKQERRVAAVVGLIQRRALVGGASEGGRTGQSERKSQSVRLGHPQRRCCKQRQACAPPQCAPSPSRSSRPRSRARCCSSRAQSAQSVDQHRVRCARATTRACRPRVSGAHRQVERHLGGHLMMTLAPCHPQTLSRDLLFGTRGRRVHAVCLLLLPHPRGAPLAHSR